MVSHYLKRIQAVMSKRVPKDANGTPWKFERSRTLEHCHEYAFEVPTGYSFLDLEKQIDALSASVGKMVEIENRGGAVIVRVPTIDLPDLIRFNPAMLSDPRLIIGYDVTGKPVYVDDTNPHQQWSGASGYGKTDALRWMCWQFIHKNPGAVVDIVDMKGFSFLPFEKYKLVRVADEIEPAYDLINDAYEEMKRRKNLIRKTGNRDLAKTFPWRLVIIDEASQMIPSPSMMKGKKIDGVYYPGEYDFASWSQSRIISISSVGREARVAIWLCTQYPTREVFNGLIKANMINVISLKLENPIDSEVAVNSPAAYMLPKKKGRAYVKNVGSVQIPFIGNDSVWETVLKPYAKEETKDERKTNEDYDNAL